MPLSDEIAVYWNDYADAYDAEARMPWAGGVRAADLAAALEPLVRRVEVVPLTDPVLWGKEIADERYLLVADLSQKATPAV